MKRAKITFNKVSKIIKEEFDRIDNYDLKKDNETKKVQILIKGISKTPVIKKESDDMNIQQLTEKIDKNIENQNKRWEQQELFNNKVCGFMDQQNKKWEQQELFNKKVYEFMEQQNKKWEQQELFNKKVLDFIDNQNKRWEQQELFNNKVYEFMDRQNKKWEQQELFNKKVLDFIEKQEKTNTIILNAIHECLNEIKLIKSLPTIQKEMNENYH